VTTLLAFIIVAAAAADDDDDDYAADDDDDACVAANMHAFYVTVCILYVRGSGSNHMHKLVLAVTYTAWKPAAVACCCCCRRASRGVCQALPVFLGDRPVPVNHMKATKRTFHLEMLLFLLLEPRTTASACSECCPMPRCMCEWNHQWKS
jgi:hypothetical protein